MNTTVHPQKKKTFTFDCQVALAVINRQLKRGADRISLAYIDSRNGRDVYEYEARSGRLLIRGSSTISLCRGFYDYIRDHALGMVDWSGAHIREPDVWPEAAVKRVQSPFRLRHCYNVVTAGYTFPYWTWERWEQELDWLALHGYNMILAPVATEAIATRVWQSMGLSQDEIDAFYVGPAHLPWQRMGNIQGVGGALDAEWHLDQVELQHKILARCRALGIEPVIQGVAGFVPEAVRRIDPNARLHQTSWNAAFKPEQRPFMIMPDDPLFRRITKAYIREWKQEFGKAHFYLVDSFNEMALPETKRPVGELLANYGQQTFGAIHAADPEGVWVLQGWMFFYQRNIWSNETVKALLAAVPDNRMLILDYANDYNDRRGINQNWQDFEGFHGKSWMMGYVPNMGGKTAYTGKMAFYAAQVEKTLGHPLGKGVAGFTASDEGFENNTIIHELLSDTAWSAQAIDLEAWTERYCRARYGDVYPKEMQKAWALYRETCYGELKAHPRFGWQTMQCSRGTINHDRAFVEGVTCFLASRSHYGDSPAYRDDAVEMAALALGLRADEWFVADQADVLGDWLTGQVGCEWTSLDWDVLPDDLARFKGIRLEPKGSRDGFEIASVCLIADGSEKVPGMPMGGDLLSWRIEVPAGIQANNGGCVRAVIRCNNHEQSHGRVCMITV